jgi:hypothetical protein
MFNRRTAGIMSNSSDPRRRNSSGSRKPKRRKSGSGMGMGKSAAIGFAVVLGLAVVGYGVTKLLSGGGASVMDRIANATGMSDSPVSLLKEAESIGESFRSLMRTIKDVPSAEATIPKARQLLSRTYQLELRAARAPIATDEQKQEWLKWAKDRSDKKLAEMKEQPTEEHVIPLTRDQVPAELSQIERDLFWRMSAATKSVSELVEEVQPATSDFETLAFERRQLQKQAKRLVMGVDGAADVGSAAKSLEQMAAEMQELVSRKAKLFVHNSLGSDGTIAWMQAGTKYHSGVHNPTWDYHMEQLESQSVDVTPLKKALEQFSAAERELTFSSSHVVNQSTSSPPGAGQPIGNTGSPPQPFGGAFPAGMPIGYPAFSIPANGDRAGDLLRAAQPDEIILIVNADTPADSGRTAEQQAQWETQINRKMDLFLGYMQSRHMARIGDAGKAGNQNVIRLLGGGTPQFLANKIDMPLVKVVSVDNAKRTITLALAETVAAPVPSRP